MNPDCVKLSIAIIILYQAYLNSKKPDATDISKDHRAGCTTISHKNTSKTISPCPFTICMSFRQNLPMFYLDFHFKILYMYAITMISIQFWRLVILYSALTTKTGILKFKSTKLPLSFSLNISLDEVCPKLRNVQGCSRCSRCSRYMPYICHFFLFKWFYCCKSCKMITIFLERMCVICSICSTSKINDHTDR